MPIKSKYMFVASMDVAADKEALFNEVYDQEHVPNLLKVPGVHAVTRIAGEPFAMSIGGEVAEIDDDFTANRVTFQSQQLAVPGCGFSLPLDNGEALV